MSTPRRNDREILPLRWCKECRPPFLWRFLEAGYIDRVSAASDEWAPEGSSWNPGQDGSAAALLLAGSLADGVCHYEAKSLWRTDGTRAGTFPLAEPEERAPPRAARRFRACSTAQASGRTEPEPSAPPA